MVSFPSSFNNNFVSTLSLMAAFREWAPMERLMARIPPLTSLGREQAVTAVAALPSHIALGTSSGDVFWHDREADSMQRLDVFPKGVGVSCLALASTTDLMLAVGSYEGHLAVYQVTLCHSRHLELQTNNDLLQ